MKANKRKIRIVALWSVKAGKGDGFGLRGEYCGDKDGEVSAQVWLEKDYKANMAQIASN